MSGTRISWAICKSAPWPRHTTMPASHHSVFYRPDALPAAQQQHQSIEGRLIKEAILIRKIHNINLIRATNWDTHGTSFYKLQQPLEVTPEEDLWLVVGISLNGMLIFHCKEIIRYRQLANQASPGNWYMCIMYKVMKMFICRGCVIPVTGTGHTSVDIGVDANLEWVDKFRYLGDILSVDVDAECSCGEQNSNWME